MGYKRTGLIHISQPLDITYYLKNEAMGIHRLVFFNFIYNISSSRILSSECSALFLNFDSAVSTSASTIGVREVVGIGEDG